MDIEYKLKTILSGTLKRHERYYAYPSGAFGEALREMREGRIIGWCIVEVLTDWDAPNVETNETVVIAKSDNWN